MSNKSPVIVALDAMTREQALSLARTLQGLVWGFKVNDLLLECGVEIVSALSEYGKVFADPKLNDIPNTVKNSVKRLTEAGADIITVHGSAGERALSEAQDVAGDCSILAITVLTSFSPEGAQAVFRQSVPDAVLHFARIAKNAGVRGVVCSPQELSLLKSDSSLDQLLRVTPGVRPEWYQKAGDDQSRVMTPVEAIDQGASLLVVGRPICAVQDPREAVDKINKELGN